MTFDQIQEKLDKVEKDSTLQNLIAQANARYILYNTSESLDNFPKYTIKDDKLNLLAFHYLNLGCRFIENEHLKNGIFPLEKGASIIENIHGSPEVKTNLGNYYGLISALSYYVCFQYSKAFILIKKIENDTVISKIVSLFLSRNYQELQETINSMMVNEIYTDDYLSENNEEIDSSKNIYEITIAKSLNNFIKYFYTGDKNLLELAKINLKNLKIIAEIKNEPDVWWVVRLLIIITDGISEASLWDSLKKYFDTSDGLARNYIHSLTYKKYGGIYELFITQRNSLSKVIGEENNGCVVSIPTSSGKTRIAEIAILDSISKNKGSKVLYIAPFRSLAYEIENSLDEIFHSIGISVSHLYGGSLFSKLDEKVIDESDVIIATPEKAKAMLRGNNEILNQIKLVVIDEGHLLGANKRLIVNEIFYEELRYFIKQNTGRFLLLSAVLPNAEDLAEWLTDSSENVFKENWRPSDERLGVLQWNGNSVDLNWRSTDAERNSFNPKFIQSVEQPLKGRQTRIRHFPETKNQAIASTAYKLRTFGPVLIFVGQKRSVFTIAREYDKCLTDETEFVLKNQNDWNAFELACIESYGEKSEWLYFARKGILCHNADLLSDVRLPLERLMSKEKPRVIIATSTLGQGVNLGVSTVIFSTLYQAGNLITSRDFWNIAGRAGRAFVDHEGKILVALDTVNKKSRKVNWERNLIFDYFDKAKIDNAQSGCLELIKILKKIANSNDVSFEQLIELIADNNISDIHENSEAINNTLDWIDDGLLSLHSLNSTDDDNYGWTDDYFRNSLAYIQAEKSEEITGEEVIQFLKARTKGIVTKVGNDKSKWNSIIKSGIPLNSDLQIEDKLDKLIIIIQDYLSNDINIDSKINLLKDIENEIKEINVLSEEFIESVNEDEIRNKWLKAVPLSEIATLEEATNIVTKYYSFSLPWVLNGISKKLRNIELNVEADTIEELSILVELGLPNLVSVKIYQCGIRSRSSANEISGLYDNELWDKSIKFYKNDLINNIDKYKDLISEGAYKWIVLLSKFSRREIIVLRSVPNFTFPDKHKTTTRLLAKKINGIQYLASPDYKLLEDISTSEIDFSSVNDVDGVFFDYDESDGLWKMVNLNPYLKFEE
ncbi:DEAD/DEAH box helicase [Winogradskyella bathintestinalis]|uniref:DEAD/DEAH box helicase n=1 Tax=Winogradskyella bathintestinalis TaxID=3035208 RepID=A0ABT7ZZ69_9FLAO|nr:DEAD/DEAH box helicase [Winogradskyella bathintestinalis]MDN3494186.1 DEAD/DEAH box helicase [Winogradskyella bathintestinalis]